MHQGRRPDAPERLEFKSDAPSYRLPGIVRRHFSGAFAPLNAPYRGTTFRLLVGPKRDVHFPVNLTNVYVLAPGKYQVEYAIYEAHCKNFYDEPRGFPSSQYLKEKIFINTLELPYSKIEEQILNDFDLDPLDGRIIVFRGQYEIKPAS